MLASTAIRDARRAGLPAQSLTPLGSLRRFAPDVGDVALLAVAAAADHPEVLTAFARLPAVAAILARSASHITIGNERGVVSLHVAVPEEAGAALVWHTGSRAHTSQLQDRAQRQGFTFDNGRLLDGQAHALVAETEERFYQHLGLPDIPPELREGEDEIAVAERGDLPTLVGTTDIRGDLHMHSTWSDGRDSIDQMVFAMPAARLRVRRDHRSLGASALLAAAGGGRHRRDSGPTSTRCAPGYKRVQVLHGIEVDIMPDGSLDFDDEQLGRVRHRAGVAARPRGPRRRRADRAIPEGDPPPARERDHAPGQPDARPVERATAVDFDTLFAAAADTGTAMEVDGAPGHLDLDGVAGPPRRGRWRDVGDRQ